MTAQLSLRWAVSAISDDREVARRRLVALIFFIYWLLIFEGALRKWVFQDVQQYLFFLRDPFVILVYVYAIKTNWWPRLSPLLAGGLALWVAGLVLALAELLQGSDAVVVAYGWRNYFLYLPLAFIIASVFREADLNRLVSHSLMISIPIAILVIFQFLSPSEAIVNAGLIDVYQPGVNGAIVRTYGTFTSSAGESPFVVSLLAFALAAWILPKDRRPLGGLLLLMASAAVITCLALSGSRGAFIHAVLVLIFALSSSFLLPQANLRTRARILPFAMCLVAVVLLTTVFSQALEALLIRSAGAYVGESDVYLFGTFGRAFSGFTALFPLLFTTPLLGYGLGSFGNAFGSLSSTTLLPPSVIAEDDWARNVAELGPSIAIFYIAFRIALVIWMGRAAFIATRRSNNPLPLLLFGFCGILLVTGQITGQGSVNGFAWLFAGFCMAANRLTDPLSTADLSIDQRSPHRAGEAP